VLTVAVNFRKLFNSPAAHKFPAVCISVMFVGQSSKRRSQIMKLLCAVKCTTKRQS